MCNQCGTNNCECDCEVDLCGCKGREISSDCVVSAVDAPNIQVVEGDTFTEVITNINTTINEITQIINNIEDGTIEVERAAGVPGSTPAGTDPIIYINETTGDLYTWDGSAWNLKGGITLSSLADVFAAGTPGSQITVTSVSSTNKQIKNTFTNASWAVFTAASVNIDVTTPTNFPEYRKRWDTRMEFSGVFGIGSALLGTGAPRVITLSTIPATNRPAKIKRFPAFLNLINTNANDNAIFKGFLDMSTAGLLTFTVIGCGDTVTGCGRTWEEYTETENGNVTSGQIWINDMHYYTQA